MKAILPDFDKNSHKPTYLQLFEYIRDAIVSGEIVHGEKLPSLRNLSEALGISITTTEQAYAQLEVEGYIHSKPRSGYFISEIYGQKPYGEGFGEGIGEGSGSGTGDEKSEHGARTAKGRQSAKIFSPFALTPPSLEPPEMIYDLSSFDFSKWKKCVSKVLTDHQSSLLFESDPQGEELLRYEISKYVYSSRGVRCTPDNVLIAAGTQQITSILAMILRQMHVDHVSVEEPGYQPVITSFSNRGFAMSGITVLSDGIEIERLPVNIRSAVYTSPSNQFPTGALMPIRRRYELLDWATKNDSYIIEDDYDSELRYIGKPIPALQGLDRDNRVIYLGSFSSTLFSAIKISYMVMPPEVSQVFRSIAGSYTQTCSKTEQLALALFMEQGSYQTGIKKLRRLNSQKLQAVMAAFEKSGSVRALNTHSGISVILEVHTRKKAETLQAEAQSLGLAAIPMTEAAGKKSPKRLNFYFNQLPLDRIPKLIEALLKKW